MSIATVIFSIYAGIGIFISVTCLWQSAVTGDMTSDYLSYCKSSKHPKIQTALMYLFLAAITVVVWPFPVCLWIYEWIKER